MEKGFPQAKYVYNVCCFCPENHLQSVNALWFFEKDFLKFILTKKYCRHHLFKKHKNGVKG